MFNGKQKLDLEVNNSWPLTLNFNIIYGLNHFERNQTVH